MARHLVQISALAALLVALVFYPFMPGSHDRLAVTWSFMAQLVGIVGTVLLVPIGVAWLFFEFRWLALRKRNSGRADSGGYYFAIVATVAASLVAAAASLPLLGNIGRSLGLAWVALWTYLVARAAPSIKGLRKRTGRGIHPAPLYLIIVPAVVLLVRMTLIDQAVEYSRRQAMANSAQLIHDIETYRDKNGRYPVSLASLWRDYRPGVVGIERFDYEPAGDAYHVFFEQFASELPTREIVMYNPLDQQTIISHDSWLLLLPPEKLDNHRGYFAVQPASNPHWKYFWFD